MSKPRILGTFKVGSKFTENGMTLTCKSERPHKDIQGRPTKLLVWLGTCPECERPYSFKTGVKVWNTSWPRRCKLCKPGKARVPATKMAARKRALWLHHNKP